VGAFVQNLGHATCLEAELCALMFAIEKSRELNLRVVLIESDSVLVVHAFQANSPVPWQLKNKWNSCLALTQQMRCRCTHILREGNMVADTLAKNGQGLSVYTSHWWSSPPLFLASLLDSDASGIGITRV
jgi:ribonuclease HI